MKDNYFKDDKKGEMMKNFGPTDSKIIIDDPKESAADTSIALSNHVERWEDFDLESNKDKAND
jgi:hypothetical protein